jgi:nucleotide-binding universal stress UspA family protein
MSMDPIVAGTDGSSTANLAMDRAGELAHALGVPVHIVCVPGALEAYEWPSRISAQQIVAKAAERLQGRGIDAETHLPKDEGDAALALVAVAEQVQAQMIVVGNKGMTGVRRLLGSLPNRVSHTARCDVLIVPTDSQQVAEFGGSAIVVGTDGSSGATLAVNEAIRLSKALGGEVHIVSSAAAAESALAAAAAEGVDATAHAHEGDPADALLEVADKNEAAIIVVGSKGMHVDERERFGNVADKLSHKGTVSVLIVSADGVGGGEG